MFSPIPMCPLLFYRKLIANDSSYLVNVYILVILSIWHLHFIFVAEILVQVLKFSRITAVVSSVIRNAPFQIKTHGFDHAAVDLPSIFTDALFQSEEFVMIFNILHSISLLLLSVDMITPTSYWLRRLILNKHINAVLINVCNHITFFLF